jgi:hypothetical protein
MDPYLVQRVILCDTELFIELNISIEIKLIKLIYKIYLGYIEEIYKCVDFVLKVLKVLKYA